MIELRTCGKVCETHNTAGQLQALYLDQGEVAGGSIYYYAKDGLGSVLQMVTPNGIIVGEQDYSAYGQLISSKGIVPLVGYAGMVQQPQNELNLTWFRAYEPTAGRWLSRDPIKETGGLNLYAYVDGDPVDWLDNDGLAKGKNGGDGSASGKGTANPYKHCTPDPNDPRFLICKDKCGKTKKVRNPDYKPDTAPPVPTAPMTPAPAPAPRRLPLSPSTPAPVPMPPPLPEPEPIPIEPIPIW